MMADELANSMAPPTPCPMRMTMSQMAAGIPVNQVTARRTEKAVKTMKPRLKIFTRPKMSPTRPRVTTRTASTTVNPISIQSR